MKKNRKNKKNNKNYKLMKKKLLLKICFLKRIDVQYKDLKVMTKRKKKEHKNLPKKLKFLNSKNDFVLILYYINYKHNILNII